MITSIVILACPQPAQAASGHNRLYVITMERFGTDAMILESNGHFGLIDAGEDKSYPDGHDPRYPLREGVTTDPRCAVDDRLFATIELLGIKKFDFAIGTHTHSDHIGNLPEVLNRYPVDKVFLKRYTDERIIWKEDLWDNLYGYDRVIEAARKNNVRLIQDITDQDAYMTMGDMSIQLYNYENEWADEAHTKLKPIYDDNDNSIISVISVAGKRIYLGGDLQNHHGHEDKYGPIIGKVDFMKANHHNDCGQYTNTPGFINNLRPSIMLRTRPAPFAEFFQKRLDEMNVKVHSAGRSDVPALAFDFSSAHGIKEVTTDVFAARGFSQQNGHITYTKWDGTRMSPGLAYVNDLLCLFNADGTVSTGWKKVDGSFYYFDPKNQGAALRGFQTINSQIYYFNYHFQMQTGWVQQDHKWYYLQEDGSLLTTATTPDGWMVDDQGCCIGRWIHESNGWWWQYPNYSYPHDKWEQIGSTWYRFDSQGYMQTGWIMSSATWYYLKPSGAMASAEWIYDNGWYFLDNGGAMHTGWLQNNNRWYYLNGSGLMQTGWVQTSTGWYYLNTDGSMLSNTTTPDGWIVDANGKCVRSAGAWKQEATGQWYYEYRHGERPVDAWLSLDGAWYYFNKSGYAVTGWIKLNSNWYYFNNQCQMQTGWLKQNDTTYYLLKSGEMAVGTQIIDGISYTFDSSGALVNSSHSSHNDRSSNADTPSSGETNSGSSHTGSSNSTSPTNGDNTSRSSGHDAAEPEAASSNTPTPNEESSLSR